MGLHKTEGNLEIAKRENSVILKESNYQSNYEGFDPNSHEDHIMIAQFQNAHINSSLKLAAKIEEDFKKVTAEDIKRVANNIFKDKNLNITILGPHKSDKEFKKIIK